MYQCIGKRLGPHGEVKQCTATSETPTNPAKPQWGWLCSECANAPTKLPQLTLEIPDIDKPNRWEETENAEELEYYHGVDQTESEALGELEEIEIL